MVRLAWCLGMLLFLAGELVAQSPAHRDRAEIRERVRAHASAPASEREPLQIVALRPLTFEPAGAGEARVVDPLVDQEGRGEFEITADGWIEMSVTVRREDSGEQVPLGIYVQPADIIVFDPSGHQLAARMVEHLKDDEEVTLRMELHLSGSALLFVGGAVAPRHDHTPGRYSSRVRVHARYLDK
jgi:hypothetical protein